MSGKKGQSRTFTNETGTLPPPCAPSTPSTSPGGCSSSACCCRCCSCSSCGPQGSSSKGNNLAAQPSLSKLLRRAHSLLAQDQLLDPTMASLVSEGTTAAEKTPLASNPLFSDQEGPNMLRHVVALRKQRTALTFHLITTLVALNEVNKELENRLLNSRAVESGSPDALIWLEGQRLWKKSRAHKFQRSFQNGEDGYFHFKGLSKKPVKALSFPYLCEPSYFEKQFMMSTQGGGDTESIQQQPSEVEVAESGAFLPDAWTNFMNAKETELML